MLTKFAISQQPGANEAKQLQALYGDSQQALQRCLVLGLYALAIKATQPQGAFGLWLAKYAPSMAKQAGKNWVPKTALSNYMEMALSAMEAANIPAAEWFPGLTPKLKRQGLTLRTEGCAPHQLLLFPESELAIEDKTNRQALLDVIENRTAKTFRAEFVRMGYKVKGLKKNKLGKWEEDPDAISPVGERALQELGFSEDDLVPAPVTGGTYYAKKKDGTARAPKRSYEEQALDKAMASAAGLKATLQHWITPERITQIELLPAHTREELRLLAHHLQKLL